MPKKSDEFRNLLYLGSLANLQSALKIKPSLITEQDENGMTLLHHAAALGLSMSIGGDNNIKKIINILFNAPGIDLNIKDNRGNTPVHSAALLCGERTTCQNVFPGFLQEAEKRGFDFSTLGEHGQSVLHIAARISYTNPRGYLGRENNVQNVLRHASNPGLNVLSSSGSTAFLYAVNNCYFQEANTLLDAGANPMLCGSKGRDPLAMLEEHLQLANKTLSQYPSENKNIEAFIAQLNALKKKILSVAEVKSHGEIRRSARIIGQGGRTAGSLFSSLPGDLQAIIASYTRTDGTTHTQGEAEKIAKKHLDKPKK